MKNSTTFLVGAGLVACLQWPAAAHGDTSPEKYATELESFGVPECVQVDPTDGHINLFSVRPDCRYGIVLHLEACRGASCRANFGPLRLGPGEGDIINARDVGLRDDEFGHRDRFEIDFRVERASADASTAPDTTSGGSTDAGPDAGTDASAGSDAGPGDRLGLIRVQGVYNDRYRQERRACAGCRQSRRSPQFGAGLLSFLVALLGLRIVRRSGSDSP